MALLLRALVELAEHRGDQLRVVVDELVLACDQGDLGGLGVADVHYDVFGDRTIDLQVRRRAAGTRCCCAGAVLAWAGELSVLSIPKYKFVSVPVL